MVFAELAVAAGLAHAKSDQAGHQAEAGLDCFASVSLTMEAGGI